MYTPADGLSTPPGGLGHSAPVGFSAVGEDWPQSPLSIASKALPSVASVGIIRQIIGFNPTQSVSIRWFGNRRAMEVIFQPRRVIIPQAIAVLAMLSASTLCATQGPTHRDDVPSEVSERFTSRSARGESAEMILSRNLQSKQVVGAIFTGPTSLLSQQEQPWGRLQEMPELSDLWLHMATIDSDVLGFAATLPALERLSITECVFEKPLKLDHEVLKRLKELHLDFAQDEPVDWAFLRRMPALQRLEVWSMPVSPQFGEQFSALKCLVDLKCIVDDGSAPQIFPRLADLPPTVDIEIRRQPGNRALTAPSRSQSDDPCAGQPRNSQ